MILNQSWSWDHQLSIITNRFKSSNTGLWLACSPDTSVVKLLTWRNNRGRLFLLTQQLHQQDQNFSWTISTFSTASSSTHSICSLVVDLKDYVLAVYF